MANVKVFVRETNADTDAVCRPTLIFGPNLKLFMAPLEETYLK